MVDGLEPETVLVIQIAGSVDDFKRALDATEGLEWLGEWDLDDVADEDFYGTNARGEATVNDVAGRLFVSMANEAGLREILGLWETWQRGDTLPRGKTKWRDVFTQTRVLRRWGVEETLGESGMLDSWRDLVDPINPAEPVVCQIELFYRSNAATRRRSEEAVARMVGDIDGELVSGFVDMSDIAFHAVKVRLPAVRIRALIDVLDAGNEPVDFQLFNFRGVMYFRPTGQAVACAQAEAVEPGNFAALGEMQPPLVAVLDGAPNVQHSALRDGLLVDDIFDLVRLYRPGERRHGSAMASLVLHGAEIGQGARPGRVVYHIPILQPDAHGRAFGKLEEHVPDDVFLEDRIERAVRRLLEGDGAAVEAQAPDVRIINLSIGDPNRPFIHFPSPLARLLDHLAWRYQILFVVSAGNCSDALELDVTHDEFRALSSQEQAAKVILCLHSQLSRRRLLAPAESLNAVTVGALHADTSVPGPPGRRINLLDQVNLFSPVSRFGHGFRRAVKPDIFFPGGRQLYDEPLVGGSGYEVSQQPAPPGQRVAWDSAQPGETSGTVHMRGTSIAAALATHAAARILEALSEVRTVEGATLPETRRAIAAKALLVHGARHDNGAVQLLNDVLRPRENAHRWKEMRGRFLGYGIPDVDRAVECKEERGTVLATDEIRENEVHEYRFPLPHEMAANRIWRRLVITLAWFSPINVGHRKLREARLAVRPKEKWGEGALRLERVDADHNHVLRGTLQHEVLEAHGLIAAFVEGEALVFHVTCHADATPRLDVAIPYCLAVTLEVEEGVGVPVYTRLREGIRQQVRVPAQ